MQRKAGERRQQQRQRHPQWKALAHAAHLGVLVQLARVALPVRLSLCLGQPARVCVPEARKAAAVPDVRRVGISLLVGVGMVFAVVGNPVQHRALDRQRAEDRERTLDPRIRLE